MRKAITLAVAAGMAAVALTSPASAAKTYKHSFYLHGNSEAGEADLPDTWLGSTWHTMDSKKPEGATPKSMFVTNYLVGPNTSCSGNGLLPTWKGTASGTVKGNMTVLLHTVATPAANLKVDVFADATGGCDSSLGSTGFVPPVASEVVTVAPGHAETKVVFKKLNFKAAGNITLMLSMVGPSPAQVRVLYDSADLASSVTFTCAGKPCA